MRKIVLALALAGLTSGAVPAAHAEADIPYYKLNYHRFDDTYESEDLQARRFAYFRWDGEAYCRYLSGWNGPGAYWVGDRRRPGLGWDGGYPWQGPGTPADHDDDKTFAEYQADYIRDFRHAGECAPPRVRHRHRVHHPVVLRRKD